MSTTDPLYINPENPEQEKIIESILREIYTEISQFINDFPEITQYFDAEVEIEKATKELKIFGDKTKFFEEKEKIRETYYIQRIAISKTKELLEKIIIRNELSRESLKKTLLKVLTEMKKRYHFTTKQVFEFEQFIDNYVDYISSLNTYFERECKSDSKELFERIFEKDITEYPDLTFRIGPFGFEFTGSKESIEKLDGKEGIVGFAGILHDKDSDFYYNISTPEDSETLEHERQHNIFKFFTDRIYPKLPIKSDIELIKEIMRNEGDELTQETIYLNYFRKIRERYMIRVADECLAIIKEPNGFIDSTIFLDFSGDSSYDFLEDWRKPTGTIGLNKNPVVPVYSKERYTELIDEIRDLQANDLHINPFIQFLTEDSFSRVIEPEEVATITEDIKTKPLPFEPNKELVNKVRNQVFNTEYAQIIVDIEIHINHFLNYFPEKRAALLHQLSITNIKYWIPTIIKLFDMFYLK